MVLLLFSRCDVINLIFLNILDAERSDWGLHFYFLVKLVVLTFLESTGLLIQIAKQALV